MYNFIIDPSKVSILELSTDTRIKNARYIEGDHNSCYGFKSYINYIIFKDGTRYDRPDIEIQSFYTEFGFKPHYFRILETHYENGKHIPFFIENSISPSLFALEKDLLDSEKLYKWRMVWNFHDPKSFAANKIKYSI